MIPSLINPSDVSFVFEKPAFQKMRIGTNCYGHVLKALKISINKLIENLLGLASPGRKLSEIWGSF